MSELDISFYDIAGFVGLVLYLGSYAALQLGLLNGQGYAYAILNALAAAFVLTSLVEAFNLSSVLIQGSWITISVVGIARFYYLTHRIRFTPEEEAFLQETMPNLPKIKARKLLNLGLWISGDPEAVLTQKGNPVTHLIYLNSGEAEVNSDGKTIAVCQEKSFIGEMTAITGESASASVILSKPSRYLAIPADELRDLLKRDGELKNHLETCFASTVVQKLKISNMALAQEGLIAGV